MYNIYKSAEEYGVERVRQSRTLNLFMKCISGLSLCLTGMQPQRKGRQLSGMSLSNEGPGNL